MKKEGLKITYSVSDTTPKVHKSYENRVSNQTVHSLYYLSFFYAYKGKIREKIDSENNLFLEESQYKPFQGFITIVYFISKRINA